jgi:isocitrate/isopropylmalate dehydrogenase
VTIDVTDYDLGARRWHRTGETLPDAVLEEIRGHDAILLGAVGDPACRPACSSAGCCCGCGSSSTTTSTCARSGCTRA